MLAAQLVARDQAPATLTNLEPPLAKLVAALPPHRVALLDRLDLDPSAPRPVLERDPAPPSAADAARPEPNLRAADTDRPVFPGPTEDRSPGKTRSRTASVLSQKFVDT